MPGRETAYSTIFSSVTADSGRAAALNEAVLGSQAEFLANSNIGSLYLQRGDIYFAAGDYAPALADYEQALDHISTAGEQSLAEWTETMFKAGLAAAALGDYAAAAVWYDRATQQATQLPNMALVETAAVALGNFLLGQEEVDLTAVYWPLQYNPSLDATTQRDLYWRYRGEFGWQFIATLFQHLPGQEAALEQIFASAVADMARASDLDESHAARRDFLAATNMGSFYLQRGQIRYRAEQVAAALADFEEALDRLQAGSEVTGSDLTQASLWAGLAALVQGDYGRSATWHNQGLALAAARSDLDSVLDAANRMALALQENPNLEPMQAYWPVGEDRGAREAAVANLTNPDLIWRYRAEFGFRLINRLFQASSGDEAQYEMMVDEVINDIEAAYSLNPEAHQVKRDFFVDANIGWNYLQRGKSHLAAGRYPQALADFEQAIQRIRPDSTNARNDFLDALFSSGLAELALGNFEAAQEWYRRGVSAVGEENSTLLGQAGQQLEQLLFGRTVGE
jgi:tetratricopeptide (TPR) repeat protein